MLPAAHALPAPGPVPVADGGVAVWEGDCRALLPQLAGRARLVLADPPYRLRGKHGVPDGFGKRKQFTYNTPWVPWEEWLPLAVEALDPRGGWVVVCEMGSNLYAVRDAMVAAGLTVERPLIWHVANRFHLPRPWWSSAYDVLVPGYVGKRRFFRAQVGGGRVGGHSFDLVSFPAPLAGRGVADGVPGAKPVPLMEKVIRGYTRPGDLVVDPFCGGGSTLVGCARLGRRGVGIEIRPEVAALARRRVVLPCSLRAFGEGE